VTIPQSVSKISTTFPSVYANLKTVVFAEGVTTVKPEIFDGCAKLETVVMPSTVTAIGQKAFYNCTELKNAVIPPSVTRIGAQAFAGCDTLTSVAIPESVVTIGANAFDCGAYWTAFYKNTFGTTQSGGGAASGSAGGGGTSGGASGSGSGGTSSGGSGYAISDTVGNSTITSMTVSGDTAIESFLLADGQVFDMAIRIVNTADAPVRLSLPSGYDYETIGDANPLEIPAASTNMITVTRTAAATFLVARQQLRRVE